MLPRRTLLTGSLAAIGFTGLEHGALYAKTASIVVNDVTRLNPVEVAQLIVPKNTEEIAQSIRDWPGSISVSGGCYSMGGQIAATGSLHFDMRSFNKLVRLDVEEKIARVQSGMQWRDLQTLIDPHGLSVKIMQSYANFTIGGALSVNAHGRYVGLGPIINSVRSIQIVLPDSTVVEASRSERPDLFAGTIGGYGGLGVITEVELDLVPNVRIERRVEYIPLQRYVAFFREHVLENRDAILHNADLEFPDFHDAVCITWSRTDKPVTVRDKLTPVGKTLSIDATAVWALSELPKAGYIRRTIVDPLQHNSQLIVWRNHEASLDVASLGTISTERSTFALQEYFLPVEQLETFVAEMARILVANKVNALNVSIRHSERDAASLMAWAQTEVFSLVLYYKQDSTPTAQQHVGEWTRQLIDAAISMGGTYYLPYQLHATREQFSQAYPRATDFFALKMKIDPRNRLSNKLWEKYAPAHT